MSGLRVLFARELDAAAAALAAFISCDTTQSALVEAAERLAATLSSGGRAFACGNGGSMSDAMHFAEELTGRFRENRPALAATAISDPGHLSCVANDFGYEYVFSRYIEAHARAGDFLLAISTSGTSRNVVRAVEAAKARGLVVCFLTGRINPELRSAVDIWIETPGPGRYADRVQELHIKCIHLLLSGVETLLFERGGLQDG